jgi:transposase
MPSPSIYVGIDVSSQRLDVAIGDDPVESFDNDDAGVIALCQRLIGIRCELIVLEATGGYEALAVATLAGGGLPVRVINPRQVRDFAKATGLLAKTDAMPGSCASSLNGSDRWSYLTSRRRPVNWLPWSRAGVIWCRC